MSHEAWAASATCRCGRTITYQGDIAPHWTHDDPRLLYRCPDGQPAAPVDRGRLVRCPPRDPGAEAEGREGLLGCGSTFIVALDAIADDPDHFVDCGVCGLFFGPDDPNNQPQPPTTAQPLTEATN